MNNNNFGKKIKELRKSKGYTQQTLAEKAGIDEKHLCRIETGKFFPSYSTLNKILSALNLTIQDVGLNLENTSSEINPIRSKILQIINSAKNDKELNCYLEAVKTVHKIFKLKNEI